MDKDKKAYAEAYKILEEEGAIEKKEKIANVEEYISGNKEENKMHEMLNLQDIGIFEIKSSNKIKSKLIYEHVNYYSPLTYRLYSLVFGVGQTPQFLLTNPNVRIPEGESYQYIIPSKITEEDYIYNNSPSFSVVKLIANALGIPLKNEERKKTKGELWSEILANELIIFKICSPLSDDSLQKLKESDNETIVKIFRYYLTEGNQHDERLLEGIKCKLLKYDEEIVSPEHIMPYNPHGIDETNTKSGKSTLYAKIGQKRERASMSGSLGFSTGNETNKGDLNRVMESYAHDEIQEENKTNIIQQTLTVMETGIAAVSVGKQTVHTSTCAPMSFLTNPKEVTEPVDYFNPKKTAIGAFRQLLEKLTDNYRALGSRIAIINFGNDFITVRGSRLNCHTYRKVKAVYDCIIEEVKSEFTKIMLSSDINEWMNSDLPSDYLEKIKVTCKTIPIKEVREFWEGHTEAHRHIRGGAVRRACLDFLLDIWNKHYNVDKILEKAEFYLNKILSNNLRSLNKMSAISEKYLEGFADNLLEGCKPDYLRHFILILLSHIKDNSKSKENYILFDELKNTFQNVENREEIFGGKYSRWNELKEKFLKIPPKIATKLLNDFGIQATKVEGITAFSIADYIKFEQFYQTKLYKSLSLISDSVKSVNGANGVKCIAPTTPKTPTTPQVCREDKSEELDVSKSKLKNCSFEGRKG